MNGDTDTDLKRFMRSNISSCETSGYFFCSLKACMVGDDVGGELGRSRGRETEPVFCRRTEKRRGGGDDDLCGDASRDDDDKLKLLWRAIWAFTLILYYLRLLVVGGGVGIDNARMRGASARKKLLSFICEYVGNGCWLRAGCGVSIRTAIRNVLSYQLPTSCHPSG